MKKIAHFIPLGPVLVFLGLLSGCVHGRSDEGTVFQNAPLSGLMAGCYSGTMRTQDLRKHGDFGIGTLDSLDGEMIVLDHVFYQIKPDGRAYLLKGKDTSPFATVTFFRPGLVLSPGRAMNYEELEGFLDQRLLSTNLIYAIRISGRFSSLKVRSAARQNKPFPVLTQAIQEQKVFALSDQEGTLVGFRFPAYVGGINVPGYHFHFLSKDRTFGGHVLGFQAEALQIQADEGQELLLRVPKNEEFLKADLGINLADAVVKVEK